MTDTVAILGAGAWGTALAQHLVRVRSTPSVRLWARDPLQARALAETRENRRYLPGVTLDPAICVEADLAETLHGASLILVATPIGALVEIAALARDRCNADTETLRGEKAERQDRR